MGVLDAIKGLKYGKNIINSPLEYFLHQFNTWNNHFSETELSPEDIDANCTFYPSVQFESYEDCYAHQIQRLLPENMVPFWTAKDSWGLSHVKMNSNWPIHNLT